MIEIWMNKMNGKLFLATPHWTPVTIDYDERLFHELDPSVKKIVGDRRIARGTLCQAGWLLEREDNMWFGLPMSARDHFEVIGELT